MGSLRFIHQKFFAIKLPFNRLTCPPILLFWRIPHSNWTHRFWLYKCWGICMTATCLLTCRLHNCQSFQFIIERPRPPMARQLIQKTPVVRQPGSHSVFEFMSVFSLTCSQQNHFNLAFNGPAGNAVAPMINVDLTRMCNNHPTFSLLLIDDKLAGISCCTLISVVSRFWRNDDCLPNCILDNRPLLVGWSH